MNWRIIKNFFPVLPAVVIIGSCAKISSPSGGPKDKEPPVIVKSVPPDGSRNFRGNRFSITFNEYVVLDKINEKFMVSPPMSTKPKVSLRGKSVNVELEDELRDSTTYTFYFQDAIRDLNEGNTIDNYQFVISTGPIIDSLSVTGNVYTAFTLDPPENALVLMYRNLDDTTVKSQLPEYIARADRNGYFRINNVRGGKYRLYALNDLDNSKNYNLAEENFAFLSDTLEITPEKNYLPVMKDTTVIKPVEKKVADTIVLHGEYKLILYAPLKKNHYLSSSDRKLQYQMMFTLSLPPDTMDFSFSIPGAAENSYFTEISKERDTMLVWLTDTALYRQQEIAAVVRYPFTDTTGALTEKVDTIRRRFLLPRSTRARIKPAPLRVTTNISTGSLKPGQRITLVSPAPFRQPDTSRIRLYEVVKSGKTGLPYEIRKDTLNSCRLFISASLEPGKNYLYIADSASLGTIYGENSDSSGIRFMVREPESYGKLRVNIKNYKGDRIIQLLDGNDKVLQQVYMKEDGMAEFGLLEKGTYRLRTLYDLNNDGKWTTGDFDRRMQPEPVSFYNKELNIKEDWIVEEEWDISEINVKNLKAKTQKSRTSLK
ncbi:MAG: Ig-like domain-containing protein [Bacteroidales bacterium]|nr:Ig-like domain-containing protein [Bacteroidales bacterium]